MATWNFDPAHSEIAFKVRHMMFSKVRGSFQSWNGSFEFDPTAPESGQTEVRIDVASIDTSNGDRDNHLKSGDFFDTEKFPHIVFKSTSFEKLGEGKLKVHGELTIRGTTEAITLDVDYHGKAVDPWGNDRVGFSATASLNRKAFGLTWNQALEAGGVLVGETVEIELDVQAVAAQVEAAV